MKISVETLDGKKLDDLELIPITSMKKSYFACLINPGKRIWKSDSLVYIKVGSMGTLSCWNREKEGRMQVYSPSRADALELLPNEEYLIEAQPRKVQLEIRLSPKREAINLG